MCFITNITYRQNQRNGQFCRQRMFFIIMVIFQCDFPTFLYSFCASIGGPKTLTKRVIHWTGELSTEVHCHPICLAWALTNQNGAHTMDYPAGGFTHDAIDWSTSHYRKVWVRNYTPCKYSFHRLGKSEWLTGCGSLCRLDDIKLKGQRFSIDIEVYLHLCILHISVSILSGFLLSYFAVSIPKYKIQTKKCNWTC